MIKLTEKQLFDFIKCPVLYDSIHNKQLFIQDTISLTKLIEKVSSFFYMNLLNSKVVSIDTLKRKWDRVCESNNIHSQKCLEGLDLINRLYKWAKYEELIILDLNVPYTFTLKYEDDVNISFKGEISNIALGKDKKPYLLITDFSNKYPTQPLLDMKLKYTLDSYAFKKLYNKDIGVKFHHVKSDRDYFTFRIEDDFNRLVRVIRNVALSIDNRLFYPRESVMCSSCEFLNFCKVWNG